MVVNQVSSLADNLPSYQHNLEEKIHSVQGATKTDGGVLGRAADMLRNLSHELDAGGQSPPPVTAPQHGRASTLLEGAAAGKPIPVQIQEAAPAPLQMVQSVIGPLLAPLATTGLIVVFVISFLLQRENLRDRFIRLVGSRDLHRTTEALKTRRAAASAATCCCRAW